MIVVNGKEIIYSGTFSMTSGDEVIITSPALEGRTLRFNPVSGASLIGSGTTPSNMTVTEKEIRVPVPLIDFDATGMENQFMGMLSNGRMLSGRFTLIGGKRHTIVHVELYQESLVPS